MPLAKSTAIHFNLVTVLARPIMEKKMTRKRTEQHLHFVFEPCGGEIGGKSSETAFLLDWGAHACSFEGII